MTKSLIKRLLEPGSLQLHFPFRHLHHENGRWQHHPRGLNRGSDYRIIRGGAHTTRFRRSKRSLFSMRIAGCLRTSTYSNITSPCKHAVVTHGFGFIERIIVEIICASIRRKLLKRDVGNLNFTNFFSKRKWSILLRHLSIIIGTTR